MNDTIAAISTPLSVGAISIIRVSGNDAINIVSKLFKGTNLNSVETHTIHYGFIVDKNELIDEVLVSVMKAPKTFTTEDVVEINMHGGIATTNKVLELLLSAGCRLAEEGEFTKRAFLNGRINLDEAESVMDLINSKTDLSRKISMNGLTGKTSSMIKELRDKIIELLSNIEVNIDYPEYEDIEVITLDKIRSFLPSIKESFLKILKESKSGRLLKEGINTVIIGSPNVGKSSLLNALLEEEKAIVTNIPGTTRDIVEGSVIIDGILLNINDTAGIRETSDIVEKIGVDKSLELIDKADLILMVVNNNQELSHDELELLEKIKNKPHIIVINKIDLESKIVIKDENIVRISASNLTNIDELKKKIKELFNLEGIETKDLNYLTNARSISLIKRALDIVYKIEANLDNSLIDMIEIDLKEIWNLLGEITGEVYSETLIDEIFKRFCLGK